MESRVRKVGLVIWGSRERNVSKQKEENRQRSRERSRSVEGQEEEGKFR
jgi:hypothetical protein